MRTVWSAEAGAWRCVLGVMAVLCAVSSLAAESDLPYAFFYDGRFVAPTGTVSVVSEQDGVRRAVREWISPDGRLALSSAETSYGTFDAMECVPTLSCRGTEPTAIVSDFRSFAFSRAEQGSVRLRANRGTVATDRDFEPVNVKFGPQDAKAFSMVAKEGRSSAQWLPWASLDFSDGTGLSLGLGWSGAWRADLAWADGRFTLEAGLVKTHFRLLPGETVRLPAVLVFRRGKGVSPRALQTRIHRFMVDVKSPRDEKGELIHGIQALTCGGGNKTPEMMKRIIDWKLAEKMPFDCLWVDAGWNGPAHSPNLLSNCGNMWVKYVGDWRFNPTVHPDGDLGKIADAAHAAGMRMLLWMEPERCVAHPTTALYTQHRDWLLPKADAVPDKEDRWLVVDFGNPAALDWIIETASEHIRRCKLDVFRQDFNINTLPIWQGNDAEDRQGITEIKHVMGLWKFWDTLRARFPHLVIENCASGGRRIDYEAASRAHSYCRTDFAIGHRNASQALDVQEVTLNTIPYLPFQGSESTPAVFFDDYGMLSSFASGNVFTPSDWNAGIVKNTFTDEETRWFRELFDVGRRMMPFYEGDWHPLVDAHGFPAKASREARWCAWQLDRPDLAAGFAIFFRRLEAPTRTFTAELGGIDEAATYEVETWKGATEKMSGANLRHLTVRLDAPRSVRLVFYRKTEGPGVPADRAAFAVAEHVLTVPARDAEYSIFQGGYFDGTHYYQALIRDDRPESKVFIRKIDLTGRTVAESAPLDLDHANNITFNPRIGRLLVSHCQSKGRNSYARYSLVDPKTLTVTESGDLPKPFFSMGYAADLDRYGSGEWDGCALDVWDGALRHLDSFAVEPPRTLSQGCYCDKTGMWFVRSSKGGCPCEIRLYDWSGKLLRAFPIEGLQAQGEQAPLEPESLNVADGEYYILCNHQRKKCAEVYRLRFH